MANQSIFKSKYRGDELLAFLSYCYRCGREDKAYWVYARPDMKERMRNDYYNQNLTGKWTNCQSCFPVYKVKKTAKWLGKVPAKEVDHDLSILGDGTVDIDFEFVDKSEKEEIKLEKEHEAMVKQSEDKLAWSIKKVDDNLNPVSI